MFPFQTWEGMYKGTTHSLKCQSGLRKSISEISVEKNQATNKEWINNINPNHFKKNKIQTRPQNKCMGEKEI